MGTSEIPGLFSLINWYSYAYLISYEFQIIGNERKICKC